MLSSHFQVEGIPMLVLQGQSDQKGRAAVSTDPEGMDFPNWGPKQVSTLEYTHAHMPSESTPLSPLSVALDRRPAPSRTSNSIRWGWHVESVAWRQGQPRWTS